MRRENRVAAAIITGAAGNGMGRSIALTLARQGIAVAVNYRQNRQAAQEIVSYLRDTGSTACAIQGNIFEKTDCERLVQSTLERFGRIDICVIGPGANWNPEDLQHLESEKSFADIAQEVLPVYHLMPLLLKEMSQNNGGRIIGISTNMDIPSPAYSYNVAKSARTQALLQSVPQAWKVGVTINVIAPGPVEPFEGFEEAKTYCSDSSVRQARQRVTPQDIAQAVAYLCSDDAKYISGCVLPFRF